jgi:hypothetical protein
MAILVLLTVACVICFVVGDNLYFRPDDRDARVAAAISARSPIEERESEMSDEVNILDLFLEPIKCFSQCFFHFPFLSFSVILLHLPILHSGICSYGFMPLVYFHTDI